MKTTAEGNYTNQDYYKLLEIINYRKLIPNKFSDESINIIKNLKDVVESNPF